MLTGDGDEVLRHLSFPFPHDRFPAELGAVIQRSVLEGREPAREVIHTEDNDWAVGDGIDDPNQPGACVVAHLLHVIERNSSVAELATLPLGHIAVRTQPGEAWSITRHRWPTGD